MKKINDLYKVIQSRKDDDIQGSYTSGLFKGGIGLISQKVGEEAVESVIAGISGDVKEIKYELADLLYHSLVLLAYYDIEPEEIIKELEKRKNEHRNKK